MYKVVIPSAGKGARLKDLSKHINKALVSVNQKPSISYVIEKFPDEIEIVIALGYQGDSVKDFLLIAYPNRKFTFVDIDLYEGKGSGLGYSLLKCQDYLDCPFIFIPNDSIIEEEIPLPETNWMGYSTLHDTTQYRSLNILNGLITFDVIGHLEPDLTPPLVTGNPKKLSLPSNQGIFEKSIFINLLYLYI